MKHFKFCPKCLENGEVVEMELVEGMYLLCSGCGYEIFNSYGIGYEKEGEINGTRY